MRLVATIGLIIFSLALCACGPGNTVRLLPAPALEASNLPSPTAPSISIVSFTDKRQDPEIVGKRRDGSAFTTSEDVAQWISRALADELARKGMRVTFAHTTAQARSGNPDYLVTGIIEQVWLNETSSVELVAQMRVQCSLANRKGRLWTETTNSSQTYGGLLSGSAANRLLLDTLQDLVQPVAQKILTTIGK
ncbi:MAG: hypothetical protein HDQ91_03995 [Desulfovibrio sp.]|nr:hypothetical protein [Desulfovibrio sp.]